MAVRSEQAQIEIIINGQKATSTIKEMESASKILNAQIKNLTPGTQEFIDKTKQLQQVNARLKETKASVKGVDDAMDNLKGSTQKTGGFMSSFFANLAANFIAKASEKILSFGKYSIKAYEESRQATAQLESSLRSTGGAAGITKNEITQLSSELQDLTNIDDDVTNSAASLLLTFTDVKNKAFKEAIPLIQDMAVKMAGGSGGEIDLKSATIQVGKALNDPIKGVTALSKVGVSFTEQQKIQIAAMVEAGDKAGAQAIILAELRKEFGGSAEAAAIAAGGMAKFNVKLGEFSEWLGGKIIPVMHTLGEIGSEVIDNIQPLWNSIQGAITPVKNLWSSIINLIGQFVPLSDKGSMVSGVIKGIAIGINILLAPAKILYTQVIAIVDAFNLLVNIGKSIIGMESDISGSFDRLTSNISSNVKAIGGSYDAMSSGIKKAADDFRSQQEEMAKIKAANIKKETDVELNYRKLTNKQLKQLYQDDNDQKAAAEIARRAEQKKIDDENKRIKNKQIADFRKAEEDYEEFLKKQEEKKLKDIKEANKKHGEQMAKDVQGWGDAEKAAAQKAYNSKIAINDLEIFKARGNNQKLLKLHLERLDLEKQKEIENAEQTGASVELINEKYEQKAKQMRLQNISNQADKYGQYLSQSVSDIQSFIDMSSQKNINKAGTEKDARLAMLDQEYAQKKISEQDYQKSKDKIAKEYDNKIKALKNKQAKIDKAAAIAQAAIQVPLAILKGLSSAGIAGGIAAGIFAGVELAQVIATKTPVYAHGGFTGHGTYKDSTGHRVAGVVHANEWVSPQWMTQHPVYGPQVQYLERVRQKGYAEGGFTSDQAPASAPNATVNPLQTAMQDNKQVVTAINQLGDKLDSYNGRLRVLYADFEEVADQVNKIRIDSSIQKSS